MSLKYVAPIRKLYTALVSLHIGPFGLAFKRNIQKNI